MTNRQLQAEETKRKIFAATMRLLQKQNADDIKVMDIVEEANVSVGSFYNYYSSKIEVFADSYKLEDSYFEEKVEPQLTQEDVRDRLRFFFDQYAYYNSVIANVGRLRYVLSYNNIYVERPYDKGTLGVLQHIIQWGVDTGQLRVDESTISMGHFMMVSARGLIDNWYTRREAFDLREEMRSFTDKFIYLFYVGTAEDGAAPSQEAPIEKRRMPRAL